MNVSKILASGTVAAAVMGAIGFAHAQTSPYTPSGTSTNPQTQTQGVTPAESTTSTPATPGNPNMQNQSRSTATGRMNNSTTDTANNPRTGAAGTRADGSGNMGNERVARADRN